VTDTDFKLKTHQAWRSWQPPLVHNYRIDENKNKAMKNNNLNELTYDATRKKVTTTRGAELEIKEHRGWKYVNYKGTKIGLSSIPEKHDDFLLDYVFSLQFITQPCPVINYLIYRYRLGKKISPKEYSVKFETHKICNRVKMLAY
jgi:hypothetical protein